MQLFSNNASGLLVAGVNATDNTLVLTAGEGAKFPAPAGGDYFLLTLTQGVGLESSWEIVKCTARTADTLTVARGQEGTTAAIWGAGAKAEMRLTAASAQLAAAGVMYSSRNLNTDLIAADRGYLIDLAIGSGVFSWAFPASATLGAGWSVYLRNTGGATLTLTPTGGELIDGVATVSLLPGECRLVQCDGAGLHSVRVTPALKTVNGSSLLGTGDLAVGDVTVAGVQTLTNKTITALKETKTALAANAIDLSLGNFFTKTIAGVTTLTVSNVPATGTAISFVLELTNAGSAAVTWFTGVKWAAGTAPALTAAGVDIIGFYSHDGGTTWRGLILAKDSK